MKDSNKYNFTADWLAGFVQTDGSLLVMWNKCLDRILPIKPQPIVNLTQNINELEMFQALHKWLGIGRLYTNRENVIIEIRSIDEILNVFIPLMENTPLRADKLTNLKILKEVCLMMSNKEHLTVVGLLKILDLTYFMNKATTLRTEASKNELLNLLEEKVGILPEYTIITISLNTNILPMTEEFIRGIIDGDGSFNVSFANTRRRVQANFTITMEIASISVLQELSVFFGISSVYNLPTNAARFQVQNFKDILNSIYPLLGNTPLNTIKQEHLIKTIKVCELVVKNNGYQSDDTFKDIVELAYEMNNLGKRRKLNKEEYLIRFIK